MTKTIYDISLHTVPTPSFLACGAITKGSPVIRDTTTAGYIKSATANARAIGVAKETVADTDPVAIQMAPAFVAGLLSGTVVDGDPVKADGSAGFVKATSAGTDLVIGYAQEGGSSGDYIEIRLIQAAVL